MTFYANIINNKIDGCGQCRMITSSGFQIEVTEEVYNKIIETPNYYIYDIDSNSIIPNPNYEHEEEMKAIQQRVAELKEQLDQLDLKSIRAIRANDTEYIEKYEAQAEELRQQIRELENG